MDSWPEKAPPAVDGCSSGAGRRGASASPCNIGVDKTFPKEHRLRLNSDFKRVFDEGKRAHAPHFTVIAASGPGLGHHRIGIIVGRKAAKGVARNRLKRRVREFYRTRKKNLPMKDMPAGADIVVLAKPGAAELDFEGTCAELENCWRKL